MLQAGIGTNDGTPGSKNQRNASGGPEAEKCVNTAHYPPRLTVSGMLQSFRACSSAAQVPADSSDLTLR